MPTLTTGRIANVLSLWNVTNATALFLTGVYTSRRLCVISYSNTNTIRPLSPSSTDPSTSINQLNSSCTLQIRTTETHHTHIIQDPCYKTQLHSSSAQLLDILTTNSVVMVTETSFCVKPNRIESKVLAGLIAGLVLIGQLCVTPIYYIWTKGL